MDALTLELALLFCSVVGGFAAIFYQNRNEARRLHDEHAKQQSELSLWQGKMDSEMGNLKDRMGQHESHCSERMKAIHDKIDSLIARVDAKFDRLLEAK